MIRSFIRSLLKWQEAMIAATAHPHPVALPPAPFNVEEAELDLGAAEAWVAHIDELAHQIALNIVEAEARGGGRHPAIKNGGRSSVLSKTPTTTRPNTPTPSARGRAGPTPDEESRRPRPRGRGRG
jgi:hypothetical protein